ncbi:MAG: 4Fe-4S binding protein [Proteobacteria bacterium]|nr:4Fe-4S binding protein [Pseudomonadota bacterium]MBU1744028.1 4Fe-4S binding protein [Pseudomonadota bacterium]
MNLEIEEEKCWGCKTCEVACKQENGAPDGVKLIRIGEDGPRQVDGRWHFVFRANRCRHCEAPPCADACAVTAIVKRADGIVVLNRGECVGCRACLEECPYEAIDFDEAANVAAKCNLCHHRVDRGLLPACADNVCLAHCIHLAGA